MHPSHININVKELINKHAEICLKNNGKIDGQSLFDIFLTHLKNNDAEFAIIQNVDFLNHTFHSKHSSQLMEMLKEYYVLGIFELGHIDFHKFNPPDKGLNSISDEYSLIIFSKKRPKQIKICTGPRKNGWNGLVSRHLDEYYNSLENFINTSKIDENIKPLANSTDYKDFHKGEFDARLYTNKRLGTLKTIKRQKIVPLKELVESVKVEEDQLISAPTSQLDKNNPVIAKIVNDFKQDGTPVDWNPKMYIPASVLTKGDLILVNEMSLFDFTTQSRIYLVTEEPFQELLERSKTTILRLNSNLVTPEYLFMYMKSDLFKTLSLPVCRPTGGIDKSRLFDLPVLLPKTKKPMAENKELSQKYKDFYNILRYYSTNNNQDYSEIKKNLNDSLHQSYNAILDSTFKTYLDTNLTDKENTYYENIKQNIKDSISEFNEKEYAQFDYAKYDYSLFLKPGKDVVQEDALLEELQNNYVREPHKQNIFKYIDETMSELNVNIPNGAYRSAIVLMGSILEAFLVDWAGEKDGENYFEKPYRTVNINGRKQDWYMSLNDAICRIGKVVKKWDARDKADAIREMRNSIHPKVIFKQNKKITKQECEAALEDLKDVIKSRYGDFSIYS